MHVSVLQQPGLLRACLLCLGKVSCRQQCLPFLPLQMASNCNPIITINRLSSSDRSEGAQVLSPEAITSDILQIACMQQASKQANKESPGASAM